MSHVKVTSKNQSGGVTANRISSPDVSIKTKIVTRQRAEGFLAGIVSAVIAGVIVYWITGG